MGPLSLRPRMTCSIGVSPALSLLTTSRLHAPGDLQLVNSYTHLVLSEDFQPPTRVAWLSPTPHSELQSKVSVFILRRTQALLAKHLPPLTSLTLFCKPTDKQIRLYLAVLRSKAVVTLLYGGVGAGGEDNTLAVITALRKVGTHYGYTDSVQYDIVTAVAGCRIE